MREAYVRSLLGGLILTGTTALALDGCTRPDPMLDSRTQKMQIEQGQRILTDLDRVGLTGDLSLIDFANLSPDEQKKLHVAPGTRGFVTLDQQPEAYTLKRFVLDVRGQAVVVGISNTRQSVTLEEDLALSRPTASLTFDLAKYLRYVPQREVRARQNPNLQVYPGYGGYSTVAFDDPQQYVNVPGAIISVALRGNPGVLSSLRESGQR